MKTQVIILAAGKGKRMESDEPKALCLLKGKPFLRYILDTVEKLQLPIKPVIVVGYKKEKIKEVFGNTYKYAEQLEQLGTGHAVQSAKDALDPQHDTILVLAADQPTVSKETLENIIAVHANKKPTITVATVVVENFDGWKANIYTNFGRIIRGTDGRIKKIVEFRDANTEEKKITEFNLSIYAFDSKWLWKNIDLIKNENAQGEYYLNDMVKIACDQGKSMEVVQVSNVIEALHPNSKVELGLLESLV